MSIAFLLMIPSINREIAALYLQHRNEASVRCPVENVCTRKYSAVKATEEAVRSIADRNSHLTESDEFNRLMESKKKREKQELKIEKCKLKYKELKRAGDKSRKLQLIQRMANSAKKDLSSYNTEYGRLKQQMGLNSPEASDVDLSCDEDNDIGPTNNVES